MIGDANQDIMDDNYQWRTMETIDSYSFSVDLITIMYIILIILMEAEMRCVFSKDK